MKKPHTPQKPLRLETHTIRALDAAAQPAIAGAAASDDCDVKRHAPPRDGI